MADTYTNINLAENRKADHKLEMHFVNMGTSEAPVWEILGYGVEDATMSFNHDVSTVVDILGISHTEVSAAKPQLDLDPMNIRGGQKLSAKLLSSQAETSPFERLIKRSQCRCNASKRKACCSPLQILSAATACFMAITGFLRS